MNCPNCEELIVAPSMRALPKSLASHICFSKPCSVCFENVPYNKLKTHICSLKTPILQKRMQKLCIFDIESYVDKYKQHHAMLVCCAYESQLHGNFSKVSFGNDEFEHHSLEKIESQYVCDDYMDKTLPNRIQTGHLSQNVKDKVHYDIFTPEVSAKCPSEAEIDKKAYSETKSQFSHLNCDIKRKALFKFISFFCNARHKNTVIISHGGSRYDSVLILSMLLKMNFVPDIISSGNAVISIHLKEFGITFIDSHRYLKQSLKKLPQRYGLQVGKGFFCHSFNKPENFGYNGSVPSLDDFLTAGDSRQVIREKTEFLESIKDRPYCFNDEILKYCILDVYILLKSVCGFLRQSFNFQRLLQKQYNVDPKMVTNQEGLDVLSPLTRPFVTLSSWR